MTMEEGLALEAKANGASDVEIMETFGRVTVASARQKLKQVGRITRPLLNQMLMDAYDSAENSAQRVAAVKELGKMNGLYAPERQININAKATTEELARLTDEELRRIASGEEVIDGEFEEMPDE
ncbi:MAG: hypothetical protein IE913_02050 [Halothiobacillus sp.]|nr:hypothetical protein [Halothiobacillus sp.]